MPHVGSEIDANFYQLIHRMLDTPREERGRERRFENRHSFRMAQRIAPWDGSRFPDDAEFFPIQCHDLTRSGFSFLAASAPHFNTLIVEFDAQPKAFYVGAQVLHCAPVAGRASGAVAPAERRDRSMQEAPPQVDPGKPMFLIGCRFTRRLHKPG